MSCCSLSWSRPSQTNFNCVRVVHVNGFIEDYEAPVTAGQITGKPPKHVLCSSAQLLTFDSPPIRFNELLEPGRLYFLLPHSIFQSNSSPVDMVLLVTRLTELARKTGSAAMGNGSARLEPVKPDRMVKDGGGTRGWRPELETIEEKSMRSSQSTM
ncbi:hypothetical protein J5N97_003521 [Dioscorea zingiberensis]|uniref:Uncharacterized protein n=1 Tax=Dioscorea zingiberensis TaxID=325984 RepID=A0A9D5D6U0_9LILI|nr:hypothetical protein J5N97_003521 [Dioscorea zingiberensis]